MGRFASAVFSKQTAVRFAETFVVVFLSAFTGSAMWGVSLDLTTKEGQSAVFATFTSAVILALRRAAAQLSESVQVGQAAQAEAVRVEQDAGDAADGQPQG